MDRKNDIFSIGEFALLCNTTRDTLYHYEKRGLLTPTVNESNGYRFYTPNDFYVFMFVAHLKRIGFSLNEIKHAVMSHTIGNYMNALAASQDWCRAQQEELNLRYERTQRGQHALEKIMSRPIDSPQILFAEEECLLRFAFDGNPVGKNLVECEGESFRYADANGIDIQRHYLGYYMENSRYLDHSIQDSEPAHFDSILTKMNERVACDKLFVRPAGTYLFLCCTGPLDRTLPRAIQIIGKYLGDHHFSPRNGLYAMEGIGPFFSDNPDEYVTEFSVMIE